MTQKTRFHVKARLQQALTFLQQEHVAQAQAMFEEILKEHPKHFDTLHLLGITACKAKHFHRSIELFSKALALHPRNAACLSNRGIALKELGRLDAAVMDFDAALAIDPAFTEAYYNRGNTLRIQGKLEEAVASYDQAIAIRPDYAEAHCNRGNTLKDLGDLNAAIVSLDLAIAANPCYAEAHYNRGNILYNLKRLNAAITSFDNAIALNPDYAEAYWNKSLALLLSGDFAKGWELYEWRLIKEDTRKYARGYTQPLWRGDPALQGKTVLLHSEQGLGDTIQFCRYATLVAGFGARVILDVPESLSRLLESLEGIAGVVAGTAPPPFDFHCPLLSLPLAFKSTFETIPGCQRYLRSDPAKVAYWADRLGARTRPRIGVAWSGGAIHMNDRNRSIRLSELLGYLPDSVEYVSLQKEIRDIDKDALQENPRIRHLGDELADFTDTAALCELMDLVISIDTSVAHLSGALGKPTWVLLPYVPDWRWLLDRDDSPWYPSMKLYRQEVLRDWSSVLGRIGNDLSRLAMAGNDGAYPASRG